jgi:hypothetical protein
VTTTNVAVIYYSSTGNVFTLAQSIVEGARKAFESGNPYGTSHVSGAGEPGDVQLQAARHQGQRVAEIAGALKTGLRS